MAANVVKLNVGGTRFWTTRETLLWTPDTFFSTLLGDKFTPIKDEEGAIFLDRDPVCFRVLLNYLRTKKISLDENNGVTCQILRDEAEYFGITSLVERLDKYNPSSDPVCGGLFYHGILHPLTDSKLEITDREITSLAGDQNWIAIAFLNVVYCYRFQESVGWSLKFQSEFLKSGVDYMTLNNKYGETGDKMVAVSSGSVVRLWVCSDPSKGLVGSFDVGKTVDSLFFIGSSLVATSKTGRVAVWNSVTKNWQVQDILPITSYDFSGSLLFLGCNQGTIFSLDMEKFPLRLKDDSLLIGEFYTDPKGESITALSVYMASTGSPESCIEVCYGTQSGNIRVLMQQIHHAKDGPQLFQTFSVHTHSISKVTISDKYLISVCENNNHVRTWKITRFRGRMSTQPGSIPLSSFKVGSSDHLISHVGPYGDRDQPQLFVQSTTYERRKLMLLDAASGKKICTINSSDLSDMTAFCINESDYPSRVGSRSRRFLVTGHENGTVQIWDLTTAFELYFEREIIPKKPNLRKTSSASSIDCEHVETQFSLLDMLQ